MPVSYQDSLEGVGRAAALPTLLFPPHAPAAASQQIFPVKRVWHHYAVPRVKRLSPS